MKQVYSKEITLDDIAKAVPKVKPKIKIMLKKVVNDRKKREKMTESEKFALNMPPDCTLEEEVFLRLGIKTVDKDGKFRFTSTGLNLSMAVATVLHDRKHKPLEKKRMEKIKKRRKKEKKNKKKNK